MRMISHLLRACALLCLMALPVAAQTYQPTPGGAPAPMTGIYCLNAAGTALEQCGKGAMLSPATLAVQNGHTYAGTASAPVVVGGLLTFSNAVAAPGGSAIVQNARLLSASGAQVSFNLLLFSANPTASTVSDGSAFNLAPADFGKYLGAVQLTNVIVNGTTSSIEATQLARHLTAAAGSTTIYGVLVALGSYTPVSASDLNLSLDVMPQ